MTSCEKINPEVERVSVALTTYNGQRFLLQQLDSLLAQTRRPDEVVVCDDASSDDTWALLETYAAQHPELKIHRNPVSLGVDRNFLQAMALCSGTYLMLCDQDDVWLPEKIERSLAGMRTLEAQVKAAGKDPLKTPLAVSSRALPVDEHGQPFAPLQPRQRTDSRWTWTLLGHASQGCTLLLNRALVDEALSWPQPDPTQLLDPETGKPVVYFDWTIGLAAALQGEKLDLDEVLMHYRIHRKNVTAAPDYYRGGSWSVRLERWLKQTPTGYEAYPLYQPKRQVLLRWALSSFAPRIRSDRWPLVESLLRLHEATRLRDKRKILRQLPKDYPVRLKVLACLKWLKRRS